MAILQAKVAQPDSPWTPTSGMNGHAGPTESVNGSASPSDYGSRRSSTASKRITQHAASKIAILQSKVPPPAHVDDSSESNSDTAGIPNGVHLNGHSSRRSRKGSKIAQSAALKDIVEQSEITQPNAQAHSLEGTGTVTDSLQKGSLLYRTTENYNPIGNFEPPPRKLDEKHVPATRGDVEGTFEELARLLHTSNQPLQHQAGDGSYFKHDEETGIMADIRQLGFKDLHTVRRLLEQRASGEPQDDRQYLMEAIIQLASALPEHSKNRVELTSKFMGELWNSLEHPPSSYLGDDFKYRSADGSRNNYSLPKLGAANTPYARSVNPKTITPGARPDPFLLFDSLMARQQFKENPNRVSSVFFNFASIVIHDLFQTDHKDPSISKTSSYLDCSVLYGDTQDDQNKMRTFKDGKIKPDCFAEERLLAFPPTAGVMLIMLNRFHNYVVEQLALINENGRFTKPADHLPEERRATAWKKYDEDLFQTGRLITCGLYINIILFDYLRTIINLNRSNSTWTLDPRMEVPKNVGAHRTPRGVGNQVSAEFALCYRWHASIGELDDAWIEEVYQELFGKDTSEIDLKELMMGLAKLDKEMPEDPMERPFANLKRGPDGKFDDDDLATIMTNAVEQVSGAFGARNTPNSMRAVTVLGIMQARQWNLCTFNEFRQFFGLKKFNTFEEINSDPYVAEQLKHLYEHPDYVELYPGIMIEDAKTPMIPGVGICPNHTLARAILSDAVALVRGDRFYTTDYNAKNLTNWGYNEANYDLGVNQGCVFHKLMLRALPNHFKPDSIYVHYPMTVPDENAKIMKDLGRFYDYNWEKPAYINPQVQLSNDANIKTLLARSRNCKVMWKDDLGYVMANGDHISDQKEIVRRMTRHYNWFENVKQFYQYTTQRLLAEKSAKIATINQVDIIRDVGNLAHIHFVTNLCGLPLKTEEDPKGIFTEHELWTALSVICTAIFSDSEPTKSSSLQYMSRKLAVTIGNYLESVIKSVTATSLTSRWFGNRSEAHETLGDHGYHMLRQLTETGISAHDVAFSQVVPNLVTMVPNLSRVFAQIIDFYLGEGKSHWSKIQALAEVDNHETDAQLIRYVQEGIRLNGSPGICRRAGIEHTFDEDDKQIHIQAGDKVFCSFISAARNPNTFPNPREVVLDRPPSSYDYYDTNDDDWLGNETNLVALAAMLRVVASLPGLRRAPGEQGEIKKIQQSSGYCMYMTEKQDSYFAFPTTMKLHYDGVVPAVPQTSIVSK